MAEDAAALAPPATGANALPTELIAEIFLSLPSPASFALVSRSWHAVSTDAGLVARYFLHQHGRIGALVAALGTKTLTPEVFARLLTLGAVFSRNLFNLLSRAYALPKDDSTRRIEGWLPISWGRAEIRVSEETMKAIRDEAELIRWTADPYRFMDLDWQLALCRSVTVDRRGNARFLPLESPTPEDHTALEVMLAEFREVLESKRFVPLPGDPVNALVARSCYLEPSMVPWLASVGWHLTDSYRESLLTSLLQTEDPQTRPEGVQHIALRGGHLVAETRDETLTRAIADYAELSNGAFQVSASVVGQLMAKKECLTSQYLMPILSLQSNPNFHLSFTDIATTTLRLAHNTRSTLTRPDWIIHLYDLFAKPLSMMARNVDPVLLGMYHLAKTVQSSQRTAGWHGLRPVAGVVESRIDTEENVKMFSVESLMEALVEVICSEFLVSPETILLAHASSDILDLPEVARRSALRMLRQPSKGATLLSLTSRYPFLVPLLRSSLLSHRPNLSLLPISTPDPSRPLFAPNPSFLSPIAFDYEHALGRYPLGLGSHPWVEECYEGGVRKEENGAGRGVAESVWPLEREEVLWKKKGAGEDEEEVVKLGKIDGRGFAAPVGFERWVEERVPTHGTLPVAIALLEIFDKDDEALDVVLSHAILNLNPSITHFYLQHGVPLRPHHLAAADHLGLPRLQAISDYLLQKIVEDATEVEPSVLEVEGVMGKRRVRKRGRGRGKKGAGGRAVPMEVGA